MRQLRHCWSPAPAASQRPLAQPPVPSLTSLGAVGTALPPSQTAPSLHSSSSIFTCNWLPCTCTTIMQQTSRQLTVGYLWVERGASITEHLHAGSAAHQQEAVVLFSQEVSRVALVLRLQGTSPCCSLTVPCSLCRGKGTIGPSHLQLCHQLQGHVAAIHDLQSSGIVASCTHPVELRLALSCTVGVHEQAVDD